MYFGEWTEALCGDTTIEQMILYLQYGISFWIEFIQQNIPKKRADILPSEG